MAGKDHPLYIIRIGKYLDIHDLLVYNDFLTRVTWSIQRSILLVKSASVSFKRGFEASEMLSRMTPTRLDTVVHGRDPRRIILVLHDLSVIRTRCWPIEWSGLRGAWRRCNRLYKHEATHRYKAAHKSG